MNKSLSSKRKELYEGFLKKCNTPDEESLVDIIFSAIYEQDEEAIQEDWKLIEAYVEGRINLKELINGRKKIFGEELTNG